MRQITRRRQVIATPGATGSTDRTDRTDRMDRTDGTDRTDRTDRVDRAFSTEYLTHARDQNPKPSRRSNKSI